MLVASIDVRDFVRVGFHRGCDAVNTSASLFGGARLVIRIIKEKLRSKSFLLSNTRLVVGREYGCDVVVTDSASSRQQVAFSADNDTVMVDTLGSRNPAFVNGKTIEAGLSSEMETR